MKPQSIRYSINSTPKREAVLKLYRDAGWTNYTRNPEKLMQAIGASHTLLTAHADEELVGLLRTVGDGTTICYIQDIIVHTTHRRHGIGRELLQRALELHADVRQVVLLTDDTETSRAFYRACGFRSCDDGKLVAFARFR